ncbi:acyltransferase family protein [Corynebacterium breve]|uniref:Acyltransferase family protein n=1 Tax=Corynebacterium breve TaxID=3049799 RepID=A0ABY8VD92_9CORY|nr:acyltransferase family protein [Corynebacterium breve]WIM66906.1 acyltransferase family protein [Corynebacterium breve]
MTVSAPARPGASATSPTSTYRHDLDGLRGVAIALVVIFHVFVGRVSGGVDVFLMLSGYFFLGSQLRYAVRSGARLNPWWPLWRTIRRLVPALAVVLGTTWAIMQLLTPYLIREETVRQLTAALTYTINLELPRQNADYEAASPDTSPLQHLWSMSVQGQFYLVAIALGVLVAWLVRRSLNGHRVVEKGVGPLLVVVTVVSFGWAARHGWVGTPESYYSFFSRSWELALGGVLAIYGKYIRIPQRLRSAATWLGLGMVVSTGFVVPSSLMFPGPAALLPIGGAALVILAGGGGASQLLASAPAQWLGRTAYSLYLWHWPLLIIATNELDQDRPSWWLGVIIVVVSLALAQITYRFVEKPLQQHAKRPTLNDDPLARAHASLGTLAGMRRAIGGVVIAGLVAALFAVQPLYMAGSPERGNVLLDPHEYPGAMALHGAEVPPAKPVPTEQVPGGEYGWPIGDHCFYPEEMPLHLPIENRKDGKTPCIYGDREAEKTVYIVGGSHAEQWVSAFDIMGQEMGFRVLIDVRAACPIVAGNTSGVSTMCADYGAMVIDRIIDEDPDLVVSTTTRPDERGRGEGPDVVPAGYPEFWQILADNEIPFVGLRDNPWGIDQDGEPRNTSQCWSEKHDAIECGMLREKAYAPVDPSATILQSMPNMIPVDTANFFCDEVYCPAVIGNIVVYRDMHHITNAFAVSAIPLLRPIIEPFVA